MNKSLLFTGMVFSLAAFNCISVGDELKLKDGSTVVGKMIQEIPGKSYRMLTPDGSEIVYPADKVDAISLNEKGGASSTLANPKMVVPVISSTTEHVDFKNNEPHGYADSFALGVVAGMNGNPTFGGDVRFRPFDHFGFDIGLGVSRCEVTYRGRGWDYDGYYGETKKSRTDGILWLKERYYFTERDRSSQHGLFIYQGYSAKVGPQFGCGYNYAQHFRSGIGINIEVGFISAPSKDGNENDSQAEASYGSVDKVSWSPLLLLFGVTF